MIYFMFYIARMLFIFKKRPNSFVLELQNML